MPCAHAVCPCIFAFRSTQLKRANITHINAHSNISVQLGVCVWQNSVDIVLSFSVRLMCARESYYTHLRIQYIIFNVQTTATAATRRRDNVDCGRTAVSGGGISRGVPRSPF